MSKIKNWRKFGYDIASGKKGTGWMAFTEGDIEEVMEERGDSLVEKARNFAEGWKETHQWQYEVGGKMNPMIVDGHVNWDRVENQETPFFEGYVNYMMKVIEKNKK